MSQESPDYFPQAPAWRNKSLELRPKLRETIVPPVGTSRIEKDASAFAGWAVQPAGPVIEIEERSWKQDESFVLDFGDHHVGHLQFEMAVDGEMDSPVRLRLVFAEMPLELGEPFDPYVGTLSRSWLQDELLTRDLLPHDGTFVPVELPRRYAFRFLRVKLIALPGYALRFRDFRVRSLTSADEAKVPPVTLAAPWADLDRISRRTLRNCMQEVFEDGPKRDRRLWLGDLRLQAMANSVTFQNFDLVKRCLYLFAGLTDAEGMINGCVYEYPSPHGSQANPLDYSLLFGPTLLEYLQTTSDDETARDLWPVALRQLELSWLDVDENGIWENHRNRWLFVDWNEELKKRACLAGVLAFSIRQTIALGEVVGEKEDLAVWHSRLQKLVSTTYRTYWDEHRRLALCEGQISLLSQAWLTLGQVISPKEGADALRAALRDPQTIGPISPYGCHTVIEALLHCGLEQEASMLLRKFWGGMVALGADTFWEVWDARNHRATPYGNPLLNSACHAWSCTPSYFIRRWPSLQSMP